MTCQASEFETARFIERVLALSVISLKKGDSALCESLGLNMDQLQKMNQFDAPSLYRVAEVYSRTISLDQCISFDPQALTLAIDRIMQETDESRLIDDFLMHGACKTVMRKYFGMNSSSVASRKRMLNIETRVGRIRTCSIDEAHTIYDSWLAALSMVTLSDERAKLLFVAKQSKCSIALVFKEVQQYEQVQTA